MNAVEWFICGIHTVELGKTNYLVTLGMSLSTQLTSPGQEAILISSMYTENAQIICT